ncbi:aldehyde dehydrogenase, dimeric NADP-preferring-like [Patiria miniata]|uniref:Aldehyde dehydrogenase n=1 Tax=Patiria miniata TaxID=46514 RepID=A0A913ZLJ6_PATMI|nr:aldehyde dehydrogenase, dimeric NADP-preferring-like [Patiria miniata]XP_038052652.1 aldehyde dehydrogenase, dimeric NADP-preferring-like [Patiria miniata]XP_038052653.1 aldehyde dehydrogenase, dimeric NADP-preferring-like [Patiria miniata]
MNASAIVKRARDAFRADKTRPVPRRRKMLQDLLRMVTEREQDFVDALHKDLRKHKFEAITSEVDFSKNEIINVLNHLDDWTKPQAVEKGLAMTGVPAYIQYQPFGTVLIIGAWNYPMQLTVHPLIGAIAAGNTVIIKPSELAPAFAEALAKIIPQYLDADCVQIVNGGVPITTALLKEKFDHILYTGSANIGRIVMEAAAKHLTPVSLELGGKSPCFVDEGVDMEITANRIMWAKLMNSGQTCIAPDYVICKPSLNDKLVAAMSKTIKKFYGENPKNSPDYARIINDRHYQRVMSLTKSGKVAVGGDGDASQLYVAPTILVDVKEDEPAMQEEIFGPVMPIFNVESVDKAIDFINSRDKPLTMYIMSNSKQVIKRFNEETSSGSFVANDFMMQAACETLPFGGVGKSGMGCYHGRFSFEMFSHRRACVLAQLGMEKLLSMRYPPYTDRNLGIMRWVLRKSPKKGHFRSLFSLALLGIIAGILFMVLDGKFSQ